MNKLKDEELAKSIKSRFGMKSARLGVGGVRIIRKKRMYMGGKGNEGILLKFWERS